MFRNQLEFGWHKGESIMALSENAGSPVIRYSEDETYSSINHKYAPYLRHIRSISEHNRPYQKQANQDRKPIQHVTHFNKSAYRPCSSDGALRLTEAQGDHPV
jgi:hypothetical protein